MVVFRPPTALASSVHVQLDPGGVQVHWALGNRRGAIKQGV